MLKTIFSLFLISVISFAFSTDDAVVVVPEKKDEVANLSNRINVAKLKTEIIKKTKDIKDVNKKLLSDSFLEDDKTKSDKKNIEKSVISFVESKKDSSFGKSSKSINLSNFEVKKKYTPIKYSGVKFFPKYNRFSILKFTFDDCLRDRYLTLSEWKEKYLNDISSVDSIFMNAVYYDKVLHNPSIAEDFYLKLKDINDGNLFITRLSVSDYLLRTGRVKKIDSILNAMQCIANFKLKKTCFYYKGLSVYAKTGDNHNRFIRESKDKISLSKKLYYKK